MTKKEIRENILAIEDILAEYREDEDPKDELEAERKREFADQLYADLRDLRGLLKR